MNTPIEKKIENINLPAMLFLPGHPDADSQGFVRMPNLKILYEMAAIIAMNRADSESIFELPRNKKKFNGAA